MNKRDAMKTAREITWRVCMLGEDIEYSEFEEMAREGLKFERLNIAGFDGFAVLYKNDEWQYIAAPHRRNPGKKQTCTQYAMSEVTAYAEACDALARGEFAQAQRVFDRLESADLKNKLAEGLDCLYAELGQDEVAEQMSAPMSDLEMVRELFGGLGLAVEQKRPGCCIFVSGETKPHKEELKALGFRWAPSKSAWYWKPQAA